MSVIEAGRNREDTARRSENTSTPIESRLARLQGRLSGSQLLDDAGSAGIGDPFAEVFARIATAQTPPPPTSSTPESSTSASDSDENPPEEKSSEVDDSQTESDSQWASTQATPVLIESAEQKVEVEASEASVLPASEDGSQEQPSDPPDTETEPILVARTNSQESDAESHEVGLETQEQDGDAPADPEAAQIISIETDRRRSEAKQGVVVDEQVETETLEAPAQPEPTNRSETSDEAPDEQQSRQPKQQPLNQTNDRVERRRYSDDRGIRNAPDPQSPDAQNAQPGEPTPNDPRSKNASSNTATSTKGSIDVSAMTPTANTVPLSTGAAAAVSTQVSASFSGSLGGNKINGTGTASGVNATGGTATAATTTGTGSTGSSDPPSPGLDTSAKNTRGDAASQGGSHAGAAGTDTLSAVQRAKLVQRVSRGFQHLGPNGGQIRMRLSPDALGSVQLQLNIRNGELSGTMVTQTEAAAEALREQLPQLRKSLESQGIRFDKIDIETESVTNPMDTATSDRPFGDPSGQSGQQPGDQPFAPGQPQRTHWSQVRPTTATVRTPTPRATWSTPTSGVDLRV